MSENKSKMTISARLMGFVMLCLTLLLLGCSPEARPAAIQLSELQPLPPTAETSIVPLRVAIAAVLSPQGTVESYQPLLDYMSVKLNRPIDLVQRRTYQEVNALIEQGQVDVAFVCTGAYVTGARDFGMELLAGPQVKGESVYYSYLVVPAASPANGLADLQGKVFAFTDPMSMTGYFYPSYLVHEAGYDTQSYFAETFFSYSHDKAIKAVANGIADGAAVDSLVYDAAVAQDPELARQTRIIHQSPPFGIPPVVVNPATRPQVKAELQDLLLNLMETPEGQEVLRLIGFDRFVTLQDSDYDSVRQVMSIIETDYGALEVSP